MTPSADPSRYRGKVALITGAARTPGVGLPLALRLSAGGASLLLTGRITEHEDRGSSGVTREELDSVVEDVRRAGGNAIGLPLDPTDEAEVDAIVQATVAEFGRIDMVAHLAGGISVAAGWGSLLEVTPESFERCVGLNLKGAWLVARACARRMVEQGDGGSLAFMSTVAGFADHGSAATYAIAKAGVDRLAEFLALELASHNIRANSVRVLGVDPNASRARNPFLERSVEGKDLDAWVKGLVPLGRLQSPDETAAVFEFLLSDESSFVTGEVIKVAGGGYGR